MNTLTSRQPGLPWLLALLLGGTAIAGQAQETPAGEYRDTVAEYQRLGREGNLALQAQEADVRAAQAALDAARAAFRPTLSLSARYSRADGGRTQSLPVGDLVNPAYQSLNRLLAAQGQPAPFGEIDNQEIRFLREREQDTKLSLTQPLYVPALAAGADAAAAQLDASDAARRAYERRLLRDIEIAYLDLLRAGEAVAIVRASKALLEENLRVNRVLHENGKTTRDQLLRAEAEVLAVSQQELDAGNQRDLARSYFNFLLNRPLDSAVRLSAAPAAEQVAQGAQGLLEGADDAGLSATARAAREELRQLEAGERAASAAVAVAASAYRPTLALALDLGTQGERYELGSGANYAIASLVLDFDLFDFGRRAASVDAAQARLDGVTLGRRETAERIDLEVRQASDRLRTSLASLDTATKRVEAAREGFRIAARKRDAGAIAQVEFIDARTALTAAELNLNLTRFELLIRDAELRAALALPALPASSTQRISRP